MDQRAIRLGCLHEAVKTGTHRDTLKDAAAVTKEILGRAAQFESYINGDDKPAVNQNLPRAAEDVDGFVPA